MHQASLGTIIYLSE